MSLAGYHAVVLAAGAATRFGGSKLTSPWNGGVLIEAALRIAAGAPVESVLVVTGARAAQIASVVEVFARTSSVPVRAILCTNHAQGMRASVRCGLAALPNDAAGAFIFLGDMPNVPPALPARLLTEVVAGSLAAVPAFEGRLGHPVLISARMFDEFSRSAGDGGGRAGLAGLGVRLAVVEVNDVGVLTDIDTPADLVAADRRSRQIPA